MGEFGRGGSGPRPSEGAAWVQREREADIRREAEHDHEVHLAEPRKRRWWLWPLGRRARS